MPSSGKFSKYTIVLAIYKKLIIAYCILVVLVPKYFETLYRLLIPL